MARSRPIVVWGPWPDSTTVSSGSGRQTRASDASNSSRSPPGRSQRPTAPANRRSPVKSTCGMSCCSGVRNVTEPLVWPGAWSTVISRPARLSTTAVGELLDVGGLDERRLPEDLRARCDAQPLLRVGEHLAVAGVDVGRDAVVAADRDHAHRVVDVAVGQQDRDRLEPVLPDGVLDPGDGVLAGIDDHALLAGGGRHEIAVRTQASGWESGDKHARPTGLVEPVGRRVGRTERSMRSKEVPYAGYRGRRSLCELIGSSQVISRERTVHCAAESSITECGPDMTSAGHGRPQPEANR